MDKIVHAQRNVSQLFNLSSPNKKICYSKRLKNGCGSRTKRKEGKKMGGGGS
jgi:hypothetical protein